MRRIALIIGTSLCLSGCVALVLAGAAAGLVVYDKRSLRVIERDARIFHEVHTTIIKDPEFAGSRIDVNSFNQAVLLVGQTPSASLRMKAEKIAQTTPQVKRVYDQIRIARPIGIGQINKDLWINGEVKARLLTRENLQSGSVKVVTENSVVYLMGIVNKAQAELAVDVTRRVNGVEKVVKVFQYRNG